MRKPRFQKCRVTLLILLAAWSFWGASGADAAPWKFALLGDCRGMESGEGSVNGARVSVLEPMAAEVARERPQLVLFSGDLANGSILCGSLAKQWATWKKAMGPIYEAGIPVYACRGNHEERQDFPPGHAIKAWRRFFPELPQNGPPGQEGLTFSLQVENATFIGFDVFAGRVQTLNPPGYSGLVSPWVIDQIKHSRTPWVFLFSYASAFIGHHTDGLSSAPAERDALWDALGEKGGIYMAGHDHLYVRRTAPDFLNRPVLELVVGCAGAPPYAYDNAALNDKLDRHVTPTELFINAKPASRLAGSGKSSLYQNTGGLPNYFGYMLVTVDGLKLTGVWRALTNYDMKEWRMTGKPRFETLDTFTQEAKR